jgi:hypothetical protein
VAAVEVARLADSGRPGRPLQSTTPITEAEPISA